MHENGKSWKDGGSCCTRTHTQVWLFNFVGRLVPKILAKNKKEKNDEGMG